MPRPWGLEAHHWTGQIRAPLMWGFVWGGIQAASPLALVARCGHGVRPRSSADRVRLHRLRSCRWTLARYRRRDERRSDLRPRRCRGHYGIAMAARCRPCGPRAQGSLAAPKSFRCEYSVVAPVLPCRRLGCGHDHCRRDRGRGPVPRLRSTVADPAEEASTVPRPEIGKERWPWLDGGVVPAGGGGRSRALRNARGSRAGCSYDRNRGSGGGAPGGRVLPPKR